MVDITLTLPPERTENGPGKINEDVNALKKAVAQTADLSATTLTDILAALTAINTKVTKNANDITVLKGGTVTAPTGASDLTVLAVTTSPAAPVEGQLVTFSAVVKNIGTVATDALTPTFVTFQVDADGTKVSRTAGYAQAIAPGASVTLSTSGGTNGGNAYAATLGSHAVVATVNDAANGGYGSGTTVDNNRRTLTFTVGGITTGGPSDGTTPTAYDSNGLAFTALTVAGNVAAGEPLSASLSIFYDPARTVATVLDYGFDVRQVNDSGAVISPDNTSLDIASSASESTATWTNRRRTITGSRVYPAGRYAITPYYRVAGTTSYVKSAGLTRYVVVAGSTTATRSWVSGSAGEMTPTGQFGTWRGHKDDIASIWGTNDGQAGPFTTGGQFANWTGSAVYTWNYTGGATTLAAMGNGSTDTAYVTAINKLKTEWTRISRGTLYVSIFSEANSDWPNYAPGNLEAQPLFVAAVKKLSALFKANFPAAKLGIVLGKNTAFGLDWRRMVPGYTENVKASQWLDWGGVNNFNASPAITNASQVTAQFTELEATGAPKGIEAHRTFWLGQGVPFGVMQWAGDLDSGDYPAYIQAMFDFFVANAPAVKTAPAAGQLIFEAYLNDLSDWQGYRRNVYNDGVASQIPLSAALYKTLYSSLPAA